MSSVVLFGDSLFGQFGRKPIKALEAAVPGAVVYNCAAGGLNSENSLTRAPLIAKMQADYVCISLGANDCYEGTDKFIPLAAFKNNILGILDAFQDSKIIIFPCPPVDDPSEPRETRRYNEILDTYNDVLAAVSGDRQIPIIDSRKAFSGKNYHQQDGLHLNDLGYEILVKELAKRIV